MTTFSEIEITFDEELAIGATIGFTVSIGALGAASLWTYKSIRLNSFEITTIAATPNVGEASAIGFVNAFNVDLNTSGNYEVTRAVNVVTIKSFVAGIEFSLPVSTTDGTTPTTDIFFNITNSSATPFQIDSFVISEADTNPCQNFKLTVQTSELAVEIQNPPIGANTDNPIVIELARGLIGATFRARNAGGDTVVQYYNLPNILDASNIQIQQDASPVSATVTVNMLQTFNLTLEYSIDDSNWQSENVFTLANGNYTMYVRDNLGCKVSTPFTVDAAQPSAANFYLPKANSFRFAQRVTHGDCGDYKNDENTLSCESDQLLSYTEIQQFQTCDIITTQFRSNFETITAQIENLTDGVNTPIIINQVTNNLGRQDRRDAKVFAINAFKTGIYFTSGNLYDYDTGIATGTYVLNGQLPEWGTGGNWINLLGQWLQIDSLFYDDTRNAIVLVLNNSYTGTDDVTVNVFSQYNIDNYEVYEFVVDFSSYTGKTLQIRINNSDPSFTDLEHLSEKIQVEIRHANTLEILYYSDRNTDIIYSTGIQHKIRLPYYKKQGVTEVEIDTQKTDTTAYVNEAKNYELEEIIFEPVTKEIMRKLVIALTQRILYIDGVNYRINGDEIEVEGALEDTNLYEVKATLIKAENTLSSNATIGTYNTSNAEIPTLLEQGGSYLKY